MTSTLGLEPTTGAGSALSGMWTVDPHAASVAFSGRASRFAPVFAARFPEVGGTIDLGAAGSRVDVDVQLPSMTTGNAAYDDLLTALDPFDVGAHPVGRYRSEAVHLTGAAAVVDGTLSLRGRAVRVRLSGTAVVLEQGRARLRAAGTVDRRAFGLRLDLPGCGFLVPSQLRVQVDVEVVREDA